MPVKVAKTYLYALRHPGLFAEFYFPKRVVYQSEIIEALKDGVEKLIEFHNSPLFPFPKPTHYLGSNNTSNILLPNVTLNKVFKDLNEPEVEKEDLSQNNIPMNLKIL